MGSRGREAYISVSGRLPDCHSPSSLRWYWVVDEGGISDCQTFSFISCARVLSVEITQGDARLSKTVCMRVDLQSKVTISDYIVVFVSDE